VGYEVFVDSSPPTPRTRRRLSAEERRDHLIRATITVVAARGYEHASLTEIARTAGVSKGLIWHYFADGDELMAQAARATLVRVRESVAADLDLTAPVPEIIRSAIARAAELRKTHADELAALSAIVYNLRGPDGSARLGPAEYEETYALQEALFRRGQQEGSLRALDPRLMAVTYQGAVDAMLAHLQTHPDADGAAYARALSDLLLDGMTARDG
jgi:AcrR family transcriptional regulator